MFDAVPKVRLIDGKFKEIQFTGGPQTKRFRNQQWLQPKSIWQRLRNFHFKGEGLLLVYLNAETYVEGAGKG